MATREICTGMLRGREREREKEREERERTREREKERKKEKIFNEQNVSNVTRFGVLAYFERSTLVSISKIDYGFFIYFWQRYLDTI